MFFISFIKYACFVGMAIHLYFAIAGEPLVYPLYYRLMLAMFFLIGFICYSILQKTHRTENQIFVGKIMSYTKRTYDECHFMLDVTRNTLKGIKGVILKTNDHKKLDILARKSYLLEAQQGLIEEQMKINKLVDDGMHELEKVEEELINYNCAHK